MNNRDAKEANQRVDELQYIQQRLKNLASPLEIQKKLISIREEITTIQDVTERQKMLNKLQSIKTDYLKTYKQYTGLFDNAVKEFNFQMTRLESASSSAVFDPNYFWTSLDKAEASANVLATPLFALENAVRYCNEDVTELINIVHAKKNEEQAQAKELEDLGLASQRPRSKAFSSNSTLNLLAKLHNNNMNAVENSLIKTETPTSTLNQISTQGQQSSKGSFSSTLDQSSTQEQKNSQGSISSPLNQNSTQEQQNSKGSITSPDQSSTQEQQNSKSPSLRR